MVLAASTGTVERQWRAAVLAERGWKGWNFGGAGWAEGIAAFLTT